MKYYLHNNEDWAERTLQCNCMLNLILEDKTGHKLAKSDKELPY